MIEKTVTYQSLDVVKILLDRIASAGSQVAVAVEIGCSTSYLNDVVHHKRRPGKKILGALGIQETILYTKIELPKIKPYAEEKS
jgi:hypothetical protein